MEAFLHPLQGLAEFEEIKKRCGANCGILNVSGCMESQKVHLMYGLSGLFPYHLILADDERNAKEIYEDYRFYDKNVYFYPAKDLLFFQADIHGNLLARLFDNLINNAIKYGADGKRVLVQIHAEEEVVTVSVTNYGYVIPADELPLLFNKFYRVEQSRSTNTGGTGLGLAIAKNIVDMHGGTIQVTSDLNGTVFTVRLRTNFDINRENFQMP